MGILEIAATLVVVTALFSYLNHRFLRLPTAIGVMLIALLFSLSLIALSHLGLQTERLAANVLASIDFDETLLQGMLGFLLFAGALHVNLDDLLEQKWVIAPLATVGVVLSTAIVGGLIWFPLQWLGLDVPLIWCLVFGALISPTDPIAVLGIMKSAGAPKSLETKISGESLFNDGVGVVVFLVLARIATGGHDIGALEVAEVFLVEAVGGAALGLAAGYLCYRLLRSVDNYQVEVLLTLALVMGGYALASKLHLSGPIAMVLAGLLIGNHGRRLAMSDRTRARLDTFWELTDEILNAVLFVLIGLEVLLIPRQPAFLAAGALAIPIVLLARFVSVSGTVSVLRLKRAFSPNVISILTWGGLRGGISVALALSLPAGPRRQAILAIAYAVVVFSILVQGTTIGRLVRRSASNAEAE